MSQDEAADRIESLEADNARLRDALEELLEIATTESLVERVARAIAREELGREWALQYIDRRVDMYWADYAPSARAALAKITKAHDVVERSKFLAGMSPTELRAELVCVLTPSPNLEAGQIWTTPRARLRRLIHARTLSDNGDALLWYFTPKSQNIVLSCNADFLAWIFCTGATLEES